MFRVAILSVAAAGLAACSTSLGSLPPSLNTAALPSRVGMAPVPPRPAPAHRPAAPATGAEFRNLAGVEPARAMPNGVRLDGGRALSLLNLHRLEHGLKPVALSAPLSQAAAVHAHDLARSDRVSHFGSDGSTPWDRVRRAGFEARVAAENVGAGQQTIEELFISWAQSEAHNRNLLNPLATHMGVALAFEPESEFKTFWTLVVAGAVTR